MKLSEYAKQQGISYRTAFRWWQAGQIPGYQAATGTIIVHVPQDPHAVPQRVAIYARVSPHEPQANLDRQAERLISYCAAKGYQLNRVVKEIGSGVNDSRPKLLALLEDQTITLIVVEQKDRLTRFGFRYLETLLHGQGRRLEVVNEAEDETEDLLADLTSMIYSFCARLYGQRRAKRKTEAIVKELEAGEVTDAPG
ncbi:MAG: IS607 family transposase [Ktedonobacterales bacterium]